MPKFMDIHNMPGATKAKVEEAHKKDVELQKKHGVRFTTWWIDEKQGKVFCLSEGPNAEASLAVHKEAGHPPEEIFEVIEGH